MTKKQVKNSPVYTYDYPVHDYEDNSVYLVIYCNGKNIKSLKNEDALLKALEIWESPEDIHFPLKFVSLLNYRNIARL